jgi:hypothetical protein
MKHLIPISFLLVMATVLSGCPYESPYNIDDAPQVPIDESLLGKWTAMVAKPGIEKHGKPGPVNLLLDKRTDMEYDVVITGDISELKPYRVLRNDSIKGTAFISTVADKRFLNAFINGRVYIAELVTQNNNVSILPLAEYFTSKLIKNCKELRAAVSFHYKVRLTPGYDRGFALNNLQKVN